MYDWRGMAEIVARKLVEKGQERILQRIFDGVTSDLTLDVSDYKESDEHKLLHLVWQKFPRNRSIVEGQKTIISSSTQTTVDSDMGRLNFQGNSSKSDAPWVGKKKEPLEPSNDDSASISDSVSSGCFYSIGQSRKIRYPDSKAPIRLSNRFKCLENAERSENSYKNSGIGDRKSSGSSREGWRRGSPKAFK